MSPSTRVLDRLSRVRQTAPGRWIACCPAHQDRSPSLSIRELEDGRLLLYDFGGCEVGDVLAAIGLQLSDLFAQPLGERPASHSRIPASDLLALADHEITVAVLILDEVMTCRRINPDQFARLAEAAAKVGRLRDHGRA